MKILIIEDEEEILSFLKPNLSAHGFIIDCARTGKNGITLAEENIYDLIILDLNLPDVNGSKVCEIIRKAGLTIPILILSADIEIDSKVGLLNYGADDYMTKPFSLEELIARIKALSRRPQEISNQILKIQDIELDRQKQTVRCKGKELYLTRKEFLLLEYMMAHPDAVISRGEIMEHVWDMEANLFSKTIETHILNLRKKINHNRPKPFIKTVSGRGYKFNY